MPGPLEPGFPHWGDGGRVVVAVSKVNDPLLDHFALVILLPPPDGVAQCVTGAQAGSADLVLLLLLLML